MSLRTDADFFLLLAGSYRRLLNRPLVPDGLNAADGAAWLYDAAPFGILAHDTSADPVFVYGNKRAQAIFEYGWDELTALPSRLSAEPMERRERQSFLEKVARDGFVSDYRGVRVTKSGKRFWIERATVWQLVDAGGIVRGQAAMIPQVRTIDPGA
ncbi:MEKHLA domain-containing protein [Burkholderia multivorans]|uniref:MEKHLA domain-containing protein n=1 Tax=Burkholderia multivorans TaxID=87883 RepID=UPI000841F806|nr:MEKHLA domain-containing protein [Burkholderia multivorans]AOJ96906.1 MEKHLA domain-containing protein [Burkholderia multivorans]MBU9239211.1 MEKHLA domain-containing protein [Burkholderia multivorans]MCO1345218.1 MEKHLA domain-containing protein [Burkholderia multivorans]MCO1445070.1 MEKHLA domain-containing protein [Burkholderia multivorans]MDN7449889.1 MEKHLA domain-containing protein [Burkholderia multivorans]